MPDSSIQLNLGSGGPQLKTDDDGTQHWQYMKLAFGASGTQTPVTSAAPLPVGLSAEDNAVLDAIAASLVNIDTNIGGTATDDAAYTVGTDTGAVMMGVVTSDPVDAGDAGAVAMDANRNLMVRVNYALPAGTNAIGKLAANSGVNIGDVVVASSALPAGAATSAAQATQTAALQLIDNSIVAPDAPASGATGVNMAGLAARSTDPAVVGDGDASNILGSLLGKQVAIPHALPGSSWNYSTPTGGVTDTADDVAKTAGAAGVRNYITGLQVFNGHATVGTEVVIKDGTTVLWRGWCEPAGGGCSAVFEVPLRGTAATAINVANITTGAQTYFNLQGFTAAE